MKQLLKSRLFFILAVVFSFSVQGQEIYFSTGLNITSYDFKSTDNLPLTLNSKTGQFYELGYRIKMMDDRLLYGVGLAINNLNATGGDTANHYTWETTYIGLNNQLEYVVLPSLKSPIELSAGVQMQLMTILNGEQSINGALYDLAQEDEFKGIWIQPGAIFTAKYFVNDAWQLSLGYNYSVGFNLSNSTEEKFKINNQQIRFGIHVNLN
jgi:hypothetical protein